MADHYYGVAAPGSKGDPDNVTKATSTNSSVVELRVTDGTSGMNKTELLKAIAAIARYVEQDDAPA